MRLRQGLVLLLGAAVFAAVVGPEPDRFYLTPLGLGLAYLAAAAAGGRRGGYWATAIVLVAWGLAVFWMRESVRSCSTPASRHLPAGDERQADKELHKRIRELERTLGKKTYELEIAGEALRGWE